MAGLVPAIHVFLGVAAKDADARHPQTGLRRLNKADRNGRA